MIFTAAINSLAVAGHAMCGSSTQLMARWRRKCRRIVQNRTLQIVGLHGSAYFWGSKFPLVEHWNLEPLKSPLPKCRQDFKMSPFEFGGPGKGADS
jgi:hypothetical protein